MSLLQCNTVQEVFDFVVQALIAQGRGSAVKDADGVRCKYRGPEGTMCAVGHLLPDELYYRDLEGRSAPALLDDASHIVAREHRELANQFERRVAVLNKQSHGASNSSFHSFAKELQVAHDYAARFEMESGTNDVFVPKFLEYASTVADKYNLEWKFGN